MNPVHTSCTVCGDPDAVIFDCTELAARSGVDPVLGQLGLCERCRDCFATGFVMLTPWPSVVAP